MFFQIHFYIAGLAQHNVQTKYDFRISSNEVIARNYVEADSDHICKQNAALIR